MQRRSAKFVKNNYERKASVTEMLKELQWESLEQRRKKSRLCTLYKIIHQDIKMETEGKLVTPYRSSRRKNHAMNYHVPSCSTNIRNQSFFPRTIRDWNNLHGPTASAATLEDFKISPNININTNQMSKAP